MRGLTILSILLAAAAGAEELADYEVVDAAAIPAPLAGRVGDAARGETVMAQAGCYECHNRKLDVAPDIETAADRMSTGELRLMIVEPRIRAPESAMPAYYAPGVFGVDPDDNVGRTRLTAQEVEDVVAYLGTFQSGTEK